MGRIVTVAVLVTAMLATDLAWAGPVHEVRLPITVASGSEYSTVIVQAGDHLWKISSRHLDQQGRNQPVAPFWRKVVDANRDHIRSGDPDLIFPGEKVRLPDLDAQRTAVNL